MQELEEVAQPCGDGIVDNGGAVLTTTQFTVFLKFSLLLRNSTSSAQLLRAKFHR